MTVDYKELSRELYEAITEPIPTKIKEVLQKYEEATTRCTGRTTALYHKAITELYIDFTMILLSK